MIFDSFFLLLAADNAPQGDQPGGIPFPYLAMIMIVVLGYLMVWRPESKRRQAQRDQMSALKKNDKVVTIGGIYGTVAAVNPEADRVTIKVDENTRIDFTMSAILRVLTDGDKKDKDSKAAADTSKKDAK